MPIVLCGVCRFLVYIKDLHGDANMSICSKSSLQQQLTVKVCEKKAGQLDFSVGDHAAVTNVVVEHYNRLPNLYYKNLCKQSIIYVPTLVKPSYQFVLPK